MLGQPKRSGKCHLCKKRGTCGCQRKIKAQIAADVTGKPGNATCIRMCQPATGKPCGQIARHGVCPCIWC